MTIREKLLADKVQNRQEANRLAQDALASEAKFRDLMDCFFSADYRVAQRAAWVVSHAALLDRKLILPYVERMVRLVSKANTSTTIVRNALRILRTIEVPEKVQGELMNACFMLAEKADTPIAIKGFSLHILWKLSRIHPGIISELRLLAELNVMNENAAVRNVAEKILK